MLQIVSSAMLLLPVAGDIQISPGDIALTGPGAAQRVLVLQTKEGEVRGDVTKAAKLTSSNPKVASVDASGVVHATADGDATITAIHGDGKATAKIKVQKIAEPFEPSFANHVVPVLTRIGCNSGACHGALAGKGGFKLSLRGYDPVSDHFVLTRQVLGRRVNTQEPAKSLMLLKPTLAIPHGGGLKLEVRSPEYDVLADWIASGAPGPSPKDAHIVRLEVFPGRAVLKPRTRCKSSSAPGIRTACRGTLPASPNSAAPRTWSPASMTRGL